MCIAAWLFHNFKKETHYLYCSHTSLQYKQCVSKNTTILQPNREDSYNKYKVNDLLFIWQKPKR